MDQEDYCSTYPPWIVSETQSLPLKPSLAKLPAGGIFNNLRSVSQADELGKYLTKIIAKHSGQKKKNNESLTWFNVQIGSFAE